MPVISGDHLRIDVTTNMPLGTLAQNVFYALISNTNGATDEDVLDDLQAWIEGIYLALRPIISDLVITVLMEVAVQVLGGGATPVGARTLSIAGVAAAEMNAHGVAGQINLTLLGGGRPSIKFWAGTNEAGLANGQYLGFDMTQMGNAGVAMILGPNNVNPIGSYTPGIISGDLLQFKPLAGQVTIKSLAAYQRRRKPGVGI